MLDILKMSDQDLLDAYKQKNQEAVYLSFGRFCNYNCRDVEIIVKLDKKYKYVELANNMVHEATVNFSAVFGSVQLIDSAIINFCHLQLNKIVFDRVHREKQGVEGALVLSVKKGLHGWTASCDIKSLYPSVYRTLNLSPEMIIGQLSNYEADWRKIYEARKFPENDFLRMKEITMVLEGKDAKTEGVTMTVGDLLTLMDEQKIACSAYGTLLDQSRGEGLIPAVLSFWFKGRVEMKDLSKKHARTAEALKKDGKEYTPEYEEQQRLADYYDILQGVRKVLLNSSYGSTLNAFCRFHDPRLGASTTGSGRQITTFMLETITEQLVGEHIPLVKTTSEENDDGEVENTYTINCPPGLGPVMSDTDSVDAQSIVELNGISNTIENHFYSLNKNEVIDGNKEIVWAKDVVSPCYNNLTGQISNKSVKGLYRHKVSKPRYKITLESDESVIVTSDHSIMVERNGNLVEVKPGDINTDTDICITYQHHGISNKT